MNVTFRYKKLGTWWGAEQGAGWSGLESERFFHNLELEDVDAERLLLPWVDALQDAERTCGVVGNNVSRLFLRQHVSEGLVDTNFSHLDDTMVRVAFQTDLLADLDGLDVAIADTNLERFCACHDCIEILTFDAHHSHNCILHYQTPLLGDNITFVRVGHHRLDTPSVMLKRFHFDTRGDGVSVEFVSVFPKQAWEFGYQCRERLNVFSE